MDWNELMNNIADTLRDVVVVPTGCWLLPAPDVERAREIRFAFGNETKPLCSSDQRCVNPRHCGHRWTTRLE